MKSHGLIETEWGEGLADGTGAMAGAWAAAEIAVKDGGDMGGGDMGGGDMSGGDGSEGF